MYESTNASEPRTIDERMEAFYRQSGGPNNPQIQAILEKHLLYGKDHGTPGYKETVQDAILDVFIQDPSMLLLFQAFQRWRYGGNKTAGLPADSSEIAAKIQDLQRQVDRVAQALEALTQTVESVRHEVSAAHPPPNED